LAKIANRRTWNNFAHEFDPLASSVGELVRQAGDVATWSRQTVDDADANRVRHRREHDRNDRRPLLCRENICGCVRNDDIDLEPDEFGDDLGGTLEACLRPAILDRDIATFDPAKFA
jgi:hypothetical protein